MSELTGFYGGVIRPDNLAPVIGVIGPVSYCSILLT